MVWYLFPLDVIFKALIAPDAVVDEVEYLRVTASSLVYPSFSGWFSNTKEKVVLPIPVTVKLPLYSLSDIFKLELLITSVSMIGSLLNGSLIFKLTGVYL